MKRLICVLVVLFTAFSFTTSCSKKVNTPNVEEIDPDAIDTTRTYLSDAYESKLRDSIWYYYKVLSLWESFIPPTNARDINKIDELGYLRKNYTQYFETGQSTLDYLKRLTKNKNPLRSPELNYDWYSFIDRGGYVSSEIQVGASSGLGMSVFYLQTESSGNNAHLYIKMVEVGSSADVAGLQRGDRIISMNDDDKIDYDTQKAINFRTVNNYLSSSTLKVTVRKPNNDVVTVNLSYLSGTTSPLALSKVLNVGTNKVGYFVFNSFGSVGSSSKGYTSLYYKLEDMFSTFEREGVSDLVVDLRYNGGGDVLTAEYMADRIAPQSENGKLMYTYNVNKYLEDWGWLEEGDEFGPVRFQKKGALNIRNVYFLVTSSTASASELLINSLFPTSMNVYLIGTYVVDENNKQLAENTYGKPVGFFGVPIVDDHVELYATSFKMYNRNGQGDYFAGLKPNYHVWEFANFYNFGDERESMLAAALDHIKNGTWSTSARSVSGLSVNKTKVSSGLSKASSFEGRKANNGMYRYPTRKLQIK